DGVTREKADGTTVYVPIHPSNLMITKLDLSDKWRSSRLEALARTGEVEVMERPSGEEAEEAEEKREESGG
ncbi:MAG: 60S ribosomal protein L26, partial [Candidatus Hecatellaceae archaeon]